jgi:hypothetical protein
VSVESVKVFVLLSACGGASMARDGEHATSVSAAILSLESSRHHRPYPTPPDVRPITITRHSTNCLQSDQVFRDHNVIVTAIAIQIDVTSQIHQLLIQNDEIFVTIRSSICHDFPWLGECLRLAQQD